MYKTKLVHKYNTRIHPLLYSIYHILIYNGREAKNNKTFIEMKYGSNDLDYVYSTQIWFLCRVVCYKQQVCALCSVHLYFYLRKLLNRL